MMSLDTLEVCIKSALGDVTEFCAIAFQGGEPTLVGLDFYKKLIEFEHKHNVKNVRITHAIQTNGMLIDDKWASFFADHNFLVGLSIDGDLNNHDYFRLDAQAESSHKRALSAARVLEKYRADFNILSVVTKQFAKRPDRAWKFYKQQGFRFLQFIPCLEDFSAERGNAIYSLSANDYGRFLCRTFDLWYEDYRKGDYVSVRMFDNYIQMLMGKPPENCAMAGICNAYALIEADGSVYPCDFYAVDEYLLGSVHTDSFEAMLTGKAALEFTEPSKKVEAECLSCEYAALCRGGCRRDRDYTGDGALKLNCYCESYKKFFAHAAPKMIRIAQTLRNRH